MAKTGKKAPPRTNPTIKVKVDEEFLGKSLTHADRENKRLREEITRLKNLKQGLEASHERVINKNRELEGEIARLECEKRGVESSLKDKEAKFNVVKELHDEALKKLARSTKKLLKSKGAVGALSKQIDKIFAKLITRE
jgi:chromosome segregation ATPase